MSMSRLLLVCFFFSTALPLAAQQQPGQETGRFRVYFSNRVQIEEAYKIERDGQSLVLSSKPIWLHKTGEVIPPQRNAILRMRPDFTPERLEMAEPSSPKPEITLAIEINGQIGTVRQR